MDTAREVRRRGATLPADLPDVTDFTTVRMAANARGDAIVAYPAKGQRVLYAYRKAGVRVNRRVELTWRRAGKLHHVTLR